LWQQTAQVALPLELFVSAIFDNWILWLPTCASPALPSAAGLFSALILA